MLLRLLLLLLVLTPLLQAAEMAWRGLVAGLKGGGLATTSLSAATSALPAAQLRKLGLVPSHAYSVLKVMRMLALLLLLLLLLMLLMLLLLVLTHTLSLEGQRVAARALAAARAAAQPMGLLRVARRLLRQLGRLDGGAAGGDAVERGRGRRLLFPAV